jgi:hypothetical protein
MWEKSQVYDALGLQYALDFVDTIDANVLSAAFSRTKSNKSSWSYICPSVRIKTSRSLELSLLFTHSLIEGIARAGNGFSQSVTEYEELDRKVVRMLKGALTPHVNDYKLEVEYDAEMEQEFDFVSETEEVTDSEIEVKDKNGDGHVSIEETARSSSQPISLFDENFQEPHLDVGTKERCCTKFQGLGDLLRWVRVQKEEDGCPDERVQLLDPHPSEKIPKSLKLSATSNDGPLELRIPVCNIGTGETRRLS